ncbi:MAG: hypothetical protein HQM00_01380 [Magnetococcales bacterium]|nr:hypothetical protein [Magnetococcales bacterium]
MTSLQTELRLDFAPQAQSHPESFELRAIEERGSVPLQVRPVLVPAWTRTDALEEYAPWLDKALIQIAPGRKRVRLYCSREVASRSRLTVQGGVPLPLGRRQEPLVETLVWVQTHSKRLRHFHDRPQARILDHTRFYDRDGQELPLPEYDPDSASFHHPQAVTGALVVEYTPGYSLYEIVYDSGEAQLSAEWFREMKLAWLAGNIHDATIPVVRVIAIGPEMVDQLTFTRNFWPSHAGVRTGFRALDDEPFVREGDGYRYIPRADHSCWERCKERVQPDRALLTTKEMIAVRNCVSAEQAPRFHYVEESRVVRTERISAPDNPELYIDVARPVELVMKLKRADDAVCDQQPPAGCCPEITLRFSGAH